MSENILPLKFSLEIPLHYKPRDYRARVKLTENSAGHQVWILFSFGKPIAAYCESWSTREIFKVAGITDSRMNRHVSLFVKEHTLPGDKVKTTRLEVNEFLQAVDNF